MIGERLRIAREACGMRQAEAAKSLGIAESGISEMETGVREPRASQLAALARLYNRSVDFFFRDVPVAEELVLWRGEPSDESVARRIRREFLSLCETYERLEALLGPRPGAALPEERGPREAYGFPQAEALASKIWKLFELGAAPSESLRLVLEERYQVKIFALPLSGEASAASTRSPRFGPATLLNQDSRSWRRNFDLAHELFHLLTWGIFRNASEQSSAEAGEDEERFANCFASHLLLPEAPFRESLAPFVDREGGLKMAVADVHSIARSFEVSAEAVVYRCAGLLHWQKETTQSVVSKVLGFRVWRESQSIESLPSRYVELVLRSYRQGLISFGKGAEFLRMGHKQAREILEPPDDGSAFDRQISVSGN
jgi:XRE family transcriptional regulator, fatty acid utilization regulator